MQGLEIARAFFEQYGRPMLEEQFGPQLPQIAVGLIGSGSECFGFDDEVSRDHDFEPGFIIFLPDEETIDRRTAFLMERAYTKLPREFMGLKRSLMAPVGGPRHGVMRAAEFFQDKVGSPDGTLSLYQWLTVPEASLAEAVNGEIFYDGPGTVTRIRACLATYPVDIRRKKLASSLLLMAQAGQYNYTRCLAHGEKAAAQLAVHEFVQHTMKVVFLLNQVYEPYYKWSFRAMRRLTKLDLTAEVLEYLLTTDNEPEMAEEKYDVIEGICADVIDELIDQGLTEANCGDLEKHAYSVNDGILDAELRNMHILAAID